MRYYFNEQNECVGVQRLDDVGTINHDTYVDNSSDQQLFDMEQQGVMIDGNRFPLSILANNSGTIEIVQARVDEIIANQYKLLRSPQRDVDIAFAKKNNMLTYPSIGDQLDNLWHDIDNGLFGEDIKINSRFYSTIKEVKDTYEKGQ